MYLINYQRQQVHTLYQICVAAFLGVYDENVDNMKIHKYSYVTGENIYNEL